MDKRNETSCSKFFRMLPSWSCFAIIMATACILLAVKILPASQISGTTCDVEVCNKEGESSDCDKDHNHILLELYSCKEKREEFKSGEENCMKNKTEAEEQRNEYKSGLEKYRTQLDICLKEKVKLQNTQEMEDTTHFVEKTTLQDDLGVCMTQKDELIESKAACENEINNYKQEVRRLKREVKSLNTTSKAREESGLVMIIGSVTPQPQYWFSSSDVIPMSLHYLSYDEHKLLTEYGVPSGKKRNNLLALLALYNKAAKVFSVELSKPGFELNKQYIKKKIELLFASDAKTPVTLHFYGNCQKNTGNWYFADTYITFEEIGSLYLRHGRHRQLTIVSDCHSSGTWLVDSKTFLLNELGSCWNWTKETGIFLRIYASAMPRQNAADLLFATKAMSLEYGSIKYSTTKMLQKNQQPMVADYTEGLCDGSEYEVKLG